MNIARRLITSRPGRFVLSCIIVLSSREISAREPAASRTAAGSTTTVNATVTAPSVRLFGLSEANAWMWFGGDSGASGPRNVGAGQAFTPPVDIRVTSLRIPFGWPGADDGYQTFPVRLALRNQAGAILATSEVLVSMTPFSEVWADFPLAYVLRAGVSYSLTWWMPDGYSSGYWTSSPGNTDTTLFPFGSGLSAQGGLDDLSDWSLWSPHPWVFNLEIWGSAGAPEAEAVRLYTTTPCRLFDTRNISGPAAAWPALGAGETRTFAIEERCSLPASAKVLLVNQTVTGPIAPGELVLYRADLPSAPTTNSIPFLPGRTRANSGFLELAWDSSGTFKVLNRSTGSVHFILDVTSYLK